MNKVGSSDGLQGVQLLRAAHGTSEGSRPCGEKLSTKRSGR
jgi:hypothetical protein